jgi:hypothetical protein
LTFPLTKSQDHRFIGYHECTLSELRTLARDRGIIASNEKPLKPALVQMLLEADEHRTLDINNLLDLPPELRCLIYKFYVEEFGTVWNIYTVETMSRALGKPVHPPLARVSR